MKGIKRRVPARRVTPQEREEYRQKVEEQYPGYLEENLKLMTIVKILTGVRILYAIFYIVMTGMYGLQIVQGFMTLFSAFVFYLWYSWMLKSGKIVAVLMLFFRGISIVMGGVSILQMGFWLPFPLLFTLTAACIIEFAEAIFAIYVLFNKEVAQTIRLNKEMEKILLTSVPSQTLERMAEYKNPYSAENEEQGNEEQMHQDEGEEER